MLITNKQLSAFDSSYKAQFANSLTGFKSVNLIGSIGDNGSTNLTIVSTVTNLGSEPALIGFIIRTSKKFEKTLENIIQTQQFTINQVSGDFWKSAHQLSKVYPQDVCEFDEVGLKREYHGQSKAPFVGESNLKYSLKLKEIVAIESNDTQLIVGEVQDVVISEQGLKTDGYIDIETLHSVAISGTDSYHLTQRLSRINPLSDDKAGTNADSVPDWF